MSRWFAFFILLAAPLAGAQMSTTSQAKCTLRVDVVYATGGHAPARLRVQLLKGMSVPIAENLTNSSGTAEFPNWTLGSITWWFQGTA